LAALAADGVDRGLWEAVAEVELEWIDQAAPVRVSVEQERDAQVAFDQVLESQVVWFVAFQEDAAVPGLLEAVAEAGLVWVVQVVPGLVLAEQEQDAQVARAQASAIQVSATQAFVTQAFVTQAFVTQVFVTRVFAVQAFFARILAALAGE
jgi:hypothetical protein